MQLWKHQQDTLDWMQRRTHGYIMAQPGLGKTLIALKFIIDNGYRALILCPKTLVQSAWENDLNKFFPEFTDYAIAFAEKRKDSFEQRAQITIANFEAVNWLTQSKATLKLIDDVDVLVIDEVSSAFRSPSTKRSKNAKKVVKGIPQVFIMSGTPISKSVQDLWHPMYLIDKGERLGTTVSAFRFHYCNAVPIPGAPRGAVKWEDKPGAVQEASENIADISICYKRDDVMDLPDNQKIFMPHGLSKKARKLYDDLLKHSIHQFDCGELITGVNKAVVRNKVLQICSGSVYMEESLAREVDETRKDLLVELCLEREHTVVFFVWRHQRIAYIKALEKAGMTTSFIDGSISAAKRGEIVKDFQDGKQNVILLHPATAAHGITLTRATTTIFASPPADRAEFMEQCIARIHRGGQTKKTETIFMYAKNTLEKGVYNAILNKVNVDEYFLDEIKRLGDNT